MVDGIMDEFEDESGVDTGTSTNEDYNSTDDFYAPTSGYTSQYPTQDADYVKATTFQSTNLPYQATDPAKTLTGASAGNSWMSLDTNTTNQRFHIDLGLGKIITKIYYENFHHSGILTTRGAQNFTFWGSNTEASFLELTYATDTGWTELTLSQNTFDEHFASDAVDPKYITVTNSTSYQYYAFKFADNYGNGSHLAVRRIELQLEQTSNMTLVSNATEAEVNPSTVRGVIMEEDTDAIAINTDLKFYASRDNGANWVQGTLTDEGDYGSGKRILVGEADVSGQAADKTMKWKITTLNAKDLKINGIGLLWD